MTSSETMVLFFIMVMAREDEDCIEFLRESCRNVLAFCGCRPSLQPLTSVWCAATTALLRTAWGGVPEAPLQSPAGIGASSKHKPLEALKNCPYKATIVREHPSLNNLLHRMITMARHDEGFTELESDLTEVQLLFQDVIASAAN